MLSDALYSRGSRVDLPAENGPKGKLVVTSVASDSAAEGAKV